MIFYTEIGIRLYVMNSLGNDVKDHNNTLVTRLTIGPLTNPTNKNVYEIHLNPPVNSPFTRLLRFLVSKDVSLYSIIIEN